MTIADDLCKKCNKPLEPWEKKQGDGVCFDCSTVYCDKCRFRHEKDFHHDDDTKPSQKQPAGLGQ
jgi:hypothetical protein